MHIHGKKWRTRNVGLKKGIKKKERKKREHGNVKIEQQFWGISKYIGFLTDFWALPFTSVSSQERCFGNGSCCLQQVTGWSEESAKLVRLTELGPSLRRILYIKYWYIIDGLEAYFLTWSDDDPLVVTGNWKYPSAWRAAGRLGCLTSCGVPFCGLTGGPFDLVSCVGNSWGLKKLEMLGVERRVCCCSAGRTHMWVWGSSFCSVWTRAVLHSTSIKFYKISGAQYNSLRKFEVLTTVLRNIQVLWDKMPYQLFSSSVHLVVDSSSKHWKLFPIRLGVPSQNTCLCTNASMLANGPKGAERCVLSCSSACLRTRVLWFSSVRTKAAGISTCSLRHMWRSTRMAE